VKMLSTQTKKSRIQPGAILGMRPDLRATPAGFFIGDTMKHIPLTQGKFAIVDDIDFEWLSKYKWCAYKGGNTFYASRLYYRDGKRTTISMHREILGLKHDDPRQTDHQNRNGLHNWRDNLRACNTSQNKQNGNPYRKSSSKYKGVSWHKGHCKWHAYIKADGHLIWLGYFTTEIEAAQAYDTAAKEYFKEFANLNFGG